MTQLRSSRSSSNDGLQWLTIRRRPRRWPCASGARGCGDGHAPRRGATNQQRRCALRQKRNSGARTCPPGHESDEKRAPNNSRGSRATTALPLRTTVCSRDPQPLASGSTLTGRAVRIATPVRLTSGPGWGETSQRGSRTTPACRTDSTPTEISISRTARVCPSVAQAGPFSILAVDAQPGREETRRRDRTRDPRP